jgi:hypothetical protein
MYIYLNKLKFKINDETASHLASFYGDKNLVAFLVAEGAELDDRDNKGETAFPINGTGLLILCKVDIDPEGIFFRHTPRSACRSTG